MLYVRVITYIHTCHACVNTLPVFFPFENIKLFNINMTKTQPREEYTFNINNFELSGNLLLKLSVTIEKKWALTN